MTPRIPKWLVDLSIFANTITCGPKGLSLCARFHEGAKRGSRIHMFMVWVSNGIFWFEKDHCRKAWFRRQKSNGNV